MRQSLLFTKTQRQNPKDELSANAILLERAGFVYKNSAGVYSYLPLGWRVIRKICDIVREEMDKIGGQEMFMPALVDKKYMEATGRWNLDVGFKVRQDEKSEPNFTLGWTHEEVLTAIAAKYISSYKDVPFSAYQIQTKFRNEPRAKSGILRGREFMMKDLYSFHASEEDLMNYYEKVKEAYFKIFERCGLRTYYTLAAGGDFTASNTHEFQVLAEAGEDTIFYCDPSADKCGYAENKEISKLKAGDKCPKCGAPMKESKAIEVGNIFPLGTKYSIPLGLDFTDEDGNKKPVVMGSYGIGIGRVMGAIVEVFHNDRGIVWPETVAPYKVHLISLDPVKPRYGRGRGASGAKMEADMVYENLQKAGIEVLYDDCFATAGEKFNDADLIGLPYRVVVSPKTLKEGKVEIKKRGEEKLKLVDTANIASEIKQ